MNNIFKLIQPNAAINDVEGAEAIEVNKDTSCATVRLQPGVCGSLVIQAVVDAGKAAAKWRDQDETPSKQVDKGMNIRELPFLNEITLPIQLPQLLNDPLQPHPSVCPAPLFLTMAPSMTLLQLLRRPTMLVLLRQIYIPHFHPVASYGIHLFHQEASSTQNIRLDFHIQKSKEIQESDSQIESIGTCRLAGGVWPRQNYLNFQGGLHVFKMGTYYSVLC